MSLGSLKGSLSMAATGNTGGFVVDGRHSQNLRYAHKEVVKVARGIAAELYEAMMSGNNEAYASWKRLCEDLARPNMMQEEFVKLATPWLLDDARATLAALLRTSRNESLKERVYDVLMKDNLIRGTGGVVPLAPSIKEAYRNGRR